MLDTFPIWGGRHAQRKVGSAAILPVPRAQLSIWGFDYKFTNYDFKQTLELSSNLNVTLWQGIFKKRNEVLFK